jgi:hypothetical protein
MSNLLAELARSNREIVLGARIGADVLHGSDEQSINACCALEHLGNLVAIRHFILGLRQGCATSIRSCDIRGEREDALLCIVQAFHCISGMRNALLNLARTVKMSPEEGHSSSAVLGLVEGLDPIPVLCVRDQLLDDAMNLAVVCSADKTV